jgi:DNA-binding FadR family transcriptional regulator
MSVVNKIANWQINPSFSSRTIHGYLVRKLGINIVSGLFPPGSIMPNEAQLLQENGVSRTAMREAIKILTAKGLLESRPRVGLRVRVAKDWNLLDPDVLGWYCEHGDFATIAPKLNQMRRMVEPFAAALAAKYANAEQLAQLRHAYEGMAQAHNVDEWITFDLAFHEAILAASGNELLVPLGNMIREGLRTIFTVSANDPNNTTYSLPMHKAVLDAIANGDAVMAESKMLEILQKSSEAIGYELSE